VLQFAEWRMDPNTSKFEDYLVIADRRNKRRQHYVLLGAALPQIDLMPGHALSMLRSIQIEFALGSEDVAVEVRNPLSPARSYVEISDGRLDMP
jgi:hypothetical protein